MNGKNTNMNRQIMVRQCVLRQLIKECKILHSRVSAIMSCDSAIDYLAQEDVFGKEYPRLLNEDTFSLRQACKMGEQDLGEVVAPEL